MDPEAHRTLALLSEIDSEQKITQRSISHRLGISLGLANLLLKRMVKKGYIKITTVPGARFLRYVLTRQGVAAKTRLTYEFVKYSYQFLWDARSAMLRRFRRMKSEGHQRVALVGTGELAELAYLAMREAGLELACVVGGKRRSFLGHGVKKLKDLSKDDFDVLVVFETKDAEAVGRLELGGTKIEMLGPR